MNYSTKSWCNEVVVTTQKAFLNAGDQYKADGMAKYMKYVAPFIGISAPDRRRLLTHAWADLNTPTSDQLGHAALALMMLDEREFHYAAYDIVQKYIQVADEYFIAEYLEVLIDTKPWWDTVDGFVTAGVSPLCRRFEASSIIDDWSSSRNRWLIRSAICHQRGWKADTDIHFVLELCSRHWENREFFIAKAIGWAMRDICAIDSLSVQMFLRKHHYPNTVARREIERGLARSTNSSP